MLLEEAPHGQLLIMSAQPFDGLLQGASLGQLIEEENRDKKTGVAKGGSLMTKVGATAMLEKSLGERRAGFTRQADDHPAGKIDEGMQVVRRQRILKALGRRNFLG